jgi:hypothetical protein
MTTEAFQVIGTQPFAVASFQVGGQLQDPITDPPPAAIPRSP